MNDGIVPEQPTVRYRPTPGGSQVTFAPSMGTRRTCPCRATHGYPDTVVLAIDRERRHLSLANDALTDESMDMIETNDALTDEVEYLRGENTRLRGVGNTQAARIRELEGELHVSTGRLARLRSVVRQRADTLMADAEAADTVEISPLVGSSGSDALVPVGPAGVESEEEPEEDPEEEPEEDPEEEPIEETGNESGPSGVAGSD